MDRHHSNTIYRFGAVILSLLLCIGFAGCGSAVNEESLREMMREVAEEVYEEKEAEREAAQTDTVPEQPIQVEVVNVNEKETAEDPEPEEEPVSEAVPEETAEPAELTKEGGPSVHGQLRVEDGVLKDEKGQPFQLRGLSTHGIGWFPDYINQGAMQDIKNAGGNVFRVAMYTQADNGYISNPDNSMRLVRKAIEDAKAMDLYVIVDWHILEDGDPNAYTDRAVSFFDTIATEYANDPAVLYELCNEPNRVEWDAIERYAYTVCAVVRQRSPNAILILGTPDYSSRLSAPLSAPFPEKNLLYAYHYYAGEHPDFSALQNAVDNHLPVFVSEWGIGKDNSGGPALSAGQTFVDYLNEKGISWCLWSLCNKDEVYSVLRPDCNKTGGFTEGDLTEVGKLAFSAMGG